MKTGPKQSTLYLDIRKASIYWIDTNITIHRNGLLLGVTVHEFMLISVCQCLCHIMIVSWSHGFIGLEVSVVS